MVASGKAYDGADVLSWLQLKAQGKNAARPKPKSLSLLIKSR